MLINKQDNFVERTTFANSGRFLRSLVEFKHNIMMNISFILVTVTLIQFTAFAGTPPDSTTSVVDKTAAIYIIEEGRTLFNEGKVRDAMIKFKQASVKDPNSWKASYWMGKCHYAMNNFGYALNYANDALKQGMEESNNEIYFLLGTSYHRLGNIDSALVNYQRASASLTKARATTLWVDHHIQECQYVLSQKDQNTPSLRTKIPGDINSGYDEYGIVFSPQLDKLYFTSRRPNTTGGGMNPDDQSYFEDVYQVTINTQDGEWGEPINNLGKLNSDGFDAINYIASDESYAIITLNTTATGAKKTTKGSDICEIKANNKDGWNSPKAISNKTINTSYFEGSASLTADGNTMYFVSDRKGDKSATDIYVVQREGKSWGVAKPLPMNVNTPGRETTPFISPDGRYLFYSSDGLVGMGGYDVWVVENKGDSWGDPVNLGLAVNTVNNDTHFVLYDKLKKGYLAGFEIIGDKASIDIYELEISLSDIIKK